MTTTQQTTATSLEANYGAITSVEVDQGRAIVQYALGASVIINSNGTHIG